MLRVSYRSAKRITVFVLGGTVSLLGLLLLVLPGPGLLVLFGGLTLLATEFVWARLWLQRLRAGARYASDRARRWPPWRRDPPPPLPPSPPDPKC